MDEELWCRVRGRGLEEGQGAGGGEGGLRRSRGLEEGLVAWMKSYWPRGGAGGVDEVLGGRRR